MNKLMKNYGGLILFYGIIILSIILLNERFRYLNEQNESQVWKQEIAFQN